MNSRCILFKTNKQSNILPILFTTKTKRPRNIKLFLKAEPEKGVWVQVDFDLFLLY